MALSFEKQAFLRRLAESIEMSFDLPEAEKELAKETIIRFEATNKALADAVSHLDILYVPFKRHKKVSTKALIKRRGVLNRFKQASKAKFNKFKKRAFLAIRRLDYFSNGDKDIQELISSFEASIASLEEYLEKLYEALTNYESPDFRDSVLSTIDNVKNAEEDIDALIADRIIEHIDTELLAKSWMSEAKDKFNVGEEDHRALISKLFEERQKMLGEGTFPVPEKEQQSLNMSDAQKIHYPDYIRTMNIGEFGE